MNKSLEIVYWLFWFLFFAGYTIFSMIVGDMFVPLMNKDSGEVYKYYFEGWQYPLALIVGFLLAMHSIYKLYKIVSTKK